jgi:tRNA (guanosine-2'-O-)-methyltransferase
MPKESIDPQLQREIVEHLSQFVLERRLNTLYTAIKNRTRYLTVVLEDIFQSQNASAVLRTCECLGIQDVHIIENKNRFSINPQVVMGSAKWLTINRYKDKDNNSLDAILALKAKGYRIVATSPHLTNTSLYDFDLTKGKAAFVFGTEYTGITDTIINHSDEFVYIPTAGLTESLNISVTVAILTHYLVTKAKTLNINFYLSEEESIEVMYQWLKHTVKRSQSIEKLYIKSKSQSVTSK